jgi:hypothetical protein
LVVVLVAVMVVVVVMVAVAVVAMMVVVVVAMMVVVGMWLLEFLCFDLALVNVRCLALHGVVGLCFLQVL